MPTFEYEVLGPTGELTRGESAAPDEPALEAALRALGLYLVRAWPSSDTVEQAPPTPVGRGDARRTDVRATPRELLAFTEYLWGAAQAGLPILTTLVDLERHLDSRGLRRVTRELRRSMEEDGRTLAEAMAAHPGVFSPLYVATVGAGEETGQMEFALEQLVEYLEWHREITLQLRQATLYPAIVFSVMTLLVGLLVTVVYPRLTPVFRGFHVALPLPTRVVLAAGELLSSYGPHLAGAVVLGALLLRGVARTDAGRLLFDSARLRVPIFGPLRHQIEMARLVTYLSLFYRAGVDLLRGLSLLEEMVVNRRVARGVGEARRAIAGGETISAAFAAVGLFSPIVLRSLALGEATGRLDQALERARAYYAREVPAAVRRMLGALQPLLIVVLGGALAFIALSIFLPVLQIYEYLGK